jgi:DUF1365 family protein
VNSAIFAGRVRHTRFSPIHHTFDYRLFMMYLDLSELPALFDPYWGWSARGPALARFSRAHHLGDPSVPLDTAVRDLVSQTLSERPEGAIHLLTHLQYFGYCFNPVSFYFCHDAGGQLSALVAEVNNTPWGERQCHTFRVDAQPGPLIFEHEKTFHVSPFMPMNLHYRWTFTREPDQLSVQVQTRENDRPMLSAHMTLSRREISGRTLLETLLHHPWMTAKVTGAIYYQALRLWLKGAPFFRHPAKVRR